MLPNNNNRMSRNNKQQIAQVHAHTEQPSQQQIESAHALEPIWLKYRVRGIVLWEYDQNNPNHLRLRKQMYGQPPQFIEMDYQEFMQTVNKAAT